jgi:hypothetical protein
MLNDQFDCRDANLPVRRVTPDNAAAAPTMA